MFHLMRYDTPEAVRSCWWSKLASFQDKKKIAENIERQARYSQALCIWTDCDREGEHIGSEICEAAKKGNSRLDIKRARFSNIEKA